MKTETLIVQKNKGDRFVLTPQVRKVDFEIPFIEEDVLFLVPPNNDVVKGTWKMNSRFASHG